MRSSIYFAFVRGRQGEILAIHRLSPLARARAAMVVDLPTAKLKQNESLDHYVGAFVRDVGSAWGIESPLYLDLTRYDAEASDTRGHHIVEHLFDCARQLRLKAVPVTGPLLERGSAYVAAVARIAARDGRGAALRFSYADFIDADNLSKEIETGLSNLSLGASEVDLFLDAESLALMPSDAADESRLLTAVLDALGVAKGFPFRNVVFAASSVPDSLKAPEEGVPLKFVRKEFRVWKNLIARLDQPMVRFGDMGIWNPRQLDAGDGGAAPARVRLPLGEEQVFFRAAPNGYRELCRQAMRYAGVRDLSRSWGLDAIRECASGSGHVDNATGWVARDTNVHIETTVRDVEAYLLRLNRLKDLSLSAVSPSPWQQESLAEILGRGD